MLLNIVSNGGLSLISRVSNIFTCYLHIIFCCSSSFTAYILLFYFSRNDLVFDDQASHSTSDQSYELGGDDSSLGIDMEYEVSCYYMQIACTYVCVQAVCLYVACETTYIY